MGQMEIMPMHWNNKLMLCYELARTIFVSMMQKEIKSIDCLFLEIRRDKKMLTGNFFVLFPIKKNRIQSVSLQQS